ncbi:MAG: N-acetylmuramoyl-L-alanine amidase [Acidobacteriota bacterium]
MSTAAWVFLWLGLLALASSGSASTRVPLDADQNQVAVLEGEELFLQARPLRSEGLYAFAERFTGDRDLAASVAQANGGRRRLQAGVRYRVPFPLLTDGHKLRVLRALFPDDRPEPGGWRHVVTRGSSEAGLWHVCEWLTGRGDAWSDVVMSNTLADEVIRPGQVVLIPGRLLIPALQALLPPPEAIASGPLEYGRDASGGAYGLYRLKRGEALYSAVVVRFTGRVLADDVNELAEELARLNGIRDVTDMPVGQEVRVPVDLLLPEYLPADDPRRLEWEQDRSEVAKYSNTVRASRLEGITVILDAGHGGDDPGVDHRGTWESVYVYDVMLRVKALLEQRTAATVVPTTKAADSGYRIPDRDVLERSRSHRVLTDPPYPIKDTRVGAHLRWYLANSKYAKALQANSDPAKTVFISIHADSLHSSLRGAMAYVPATGLTSGTFGKSDRIYRARKEVKERPKVSFSWKERTRSEAFSRELADHLMRSFRKRGLGVHKEKPVRDRIIRCRRCRPFVPAVIRYNAVPTKLLFEICNMNNAKDRRLLRTRAFRQQVAEALVDGILAYYGQEPLSGPGQATAR